MNDAAQQSLAAWVPNPVLVWACVALIGLVVVLVVALLNRGFVSVAAFSRSMGAVHKKINKQAERLAVLEDRGGIRRRSDDEDDE